MIRSRRLPRAKFDAALPTLRRRTSRLGMGLSPRARAFVRLVPLLLEARFRRPSLDVEPPGVVQPPRRRRWGKLCERLELPPPTSFSQRRPLIASVLLSPRSRGGFELLIIPVEGLAVMEQQRVAQRITAVQQLATRHAPEIEVRQTSAFDLSASVFAWSGIVAGDVPAVSAATRFDWHDAFFRAPTPMLRCLMLLVRPDAPAPLDLLRATQVPSTGMGFVASWSGSSVARDLTALENQPLSPAELDGLSRQFRAACLKALRGFPLVERKKLRAVLGPALLGRRIPPVLRPHLERALRVRNLREIQTEHGWRLELEGLVLARAFSLDHLRALALTESPRLAHVGPVWQRLSTTIEAREVRALVSIEPGFLRHLIVSVPRAGRPHAQRVDAAGLLRFVLTQHHAGVPVEVIASYGADPTLVARTTQILAAPLRPDEAVGLQLGNKVVLLDGLRKRVMPLTRAFNRPRRLTWLPEQAEMYRALRKPLATGLPTVQLVAFPQGERHACLHTIDASGSLYQERVLREELEPTLQELRDVLRYAQTPSVLSACVHPLLSSLGGRRAEQDEPVIMSVLLTPHGDQAIFDGELFGSNANLSWGALAEAVLSHWPPGTSTHIGVDRVKAPVGTSALELLAARSRVLRRVDTHLRRISSLLRAA